MEAVPEFRKSVAVVIGINAYDHGVPQLKTAANDARRLARMLAEEHGYDVHLLLDEQASLAAINKLLRDELANSIENEDRVFFYFAGHGVALQGADGPSGYLLPQDARRGEPESYLHMPLLYDDLFALQCRHLLVILDSCFSGAFRWSSTRDVLVMPEVIHQERYDRFILDPAWQAIASASYDQTALDEIPVFGAFGSRGDDGTHSPFASALFEALEGAADVARGGVADGIITATELYLYLEDSLQPAAIEAGHRQTPSLWPLPKHDKGEYIFLVPGGKLDLPPAPPLNYGNNPWRGLEPYEEEHAELFFGREDAIDALAKHIDEHPLSIVLGASGTGKSSVVKAGLLPRLKRDVAQRWYVLPVVRPGAEPMQALRRAVAGLDSGAPTGTEVGVEERIAAWCLAHPGNRLVLVVDQFEELVSMTRSDATRVEVLDLLARLVAQFPEQFRLVLTLRSDFEPQFDRSALGSDWNQARYVVPPMTQDEVRSVIERPALQRVMYFKPSELVEDLINEVIQTPGGLPLLSFALSEMYIHYVNRRSDDRALEKIDFDAVGGVVGALRTRADAEFEALDATQKETMRRLLLRMVAVEGGNVARQRVPGPDLEYQDAAETGRCREIVGRLTRARLVVEGRADDGEAYVEPAHDALVRAWDRLLRWIHTEQGRVANLQFQQGLSRAAREWSLARTSAMKAGLLWRDSARAGLLALLVGHEEDQMPGSALTTGQRLRRWGRRLKRRFGGKAGAVEVRGAWMNRREMAFARRSIRRRRRIREGLAALGLIIFASAFIAWGFAIEAGIQEEIAVRRADSLGELFGRDLIKDGLVPGDMAVAEAMQSEWEPFVFRGSSVFALRSSHAGGKIVALSHDELPVDEIFMDYVLGWMLDGKDDATFLVSTSHCEVITYEIENVLARSQFSNSSIREISDLSTIGSGDPSTVLLVGNAWSAFSEAEIEAVERFVRQGGGLVVAGIGWSWNQFNGQPNFATQFCEAHPSSVGKTASTDSYPMNNLMKPLGLSWILEAPAEIDSDQ
ncbi:caspase family protein [Dokdonella sp.]|uniref:nSTAND1 domain-containing NTPase n=1 Tax=Dokdonella sp. TaxID=2291710 RepID=UPI0035272D5B